ncbi:MAG: class I mannose-6-phosphate isomerase [Bacteroidales bacterium]|nr:class I mannose-6-phosphate isomerase [Bacteroidales bacterium]
MLYPLKFKPFFKEKIWGGTKIETELHRPVRNMDRCGESWEISAIEGNVSVVDNGFFADDNDLNELIEVYMGDLVGDKVYDEFGLGFPLLIKYIDATDDLSVQVHPDDKLAQERYGMNGKTEMWYVIQAEPGAGLYVGFKDGVSRDDYWDAVEAGNVDELLKFYPVKKGDLFFIPAGTVHAIGKGVLLAEIQQPSDVTYRIFDWNRVDENGNSRELHIDEAIDAIHFENMANEESQDAPQSDDENENREKTEEKCTIPAGKVDFEEKFDTTSPLLRSKFFNLNEIYFEKPLKKNYAEIDSFVIYMCIEGSVQCFTDEEQTELNQGEVMLVPACTNELNLIPTQKSKLLEVYL